MACKPDSVGDDHSSGGVVADTLLRPTRNASREQRTIPVWSCSKRGLPCHGRYRRVRCALTAPFHPCPHRWRVGGLFSAALSIASRRPGVIRRYALWSPDFPLHLADKATVQPTRFLLYGSIGAAIHNIGDLCKFMSGLRKRLPGRILGLLIGKDA